MTALPVIYKTDKGEIVELNRRKFLKIVGGVAAGTGLSSWMMNSLLSSPNYSESDYLFGPVNESWANSLCSLCRSGCGISVRLLNGVPVKIEGNKLHPMNRGGVCARGQAGLEVLYNPNRIKNPKKRIGDRGEGRWQDISWEEAQATLTNNLKKLSESDQSDGLMFLTNNISDPLDHLLKRFSEAFGTPNYFKCGLNSPHQPHFELMHGINNEFAYDLENTNYILSFGSQFLESEPAMGWYSRMYGLMRRGRNGRRVKIVQIDSQLSVTGIQADEWIPINPGTYGALALGIAHILIRENLVENNFLKNNTFGFENWRGKNGENHDGFKELVLRDYTPDAVAKITGVKPETLVRLTQEFASHKPSLALIGSRCNWLSNGVHTTRAVHALNALIGNIGASGGIISRKNVPFAKLIQVNRPENSSKKKSKGLDQQFLKEIRSRGWIGENEITKLLTHESEDKIKTLLLYNSDLLHASTQRNKLEKALKEIPFIVSFSSFQDETASFADLLLPDHTYLEKWQAATAPVGMTGNHVGISAPVLKPLYYTKDIGDVLLNISSEVNSNLSGYLPWTSYENYLMELIEGVYNSERGLVFQESYDESWMRFLEQRGWRYPAYFSFIEFWNDLIKKGGWWEPHFQQEKITFNTPSKKFEFYSQNLKINNIEKKDDLWFLPHYSPGPINENDQEYQFYLNPYLLTTIGTGEGAIQPTMLEMLGIHIKQKWTPWIEINPGDAKRIGLKEQDWVWLVSPKGKLKAQLRLYPAAAQGTVSAPLGLSRTKIGRAADNSDPNLLSIILPNSDAVTGQTAFLETKINLIKI